VPDPAPVIAYLDGPDSARVSPVEVCRLIGLRDPEVLLGWTPGDRPWLADDRLRGRTFIAGYQLAKAVGVGRLRYLPVRLSAVPRLVGSIRPAVAVVSAIRRGSGFAFRGTVGWGPAAVQAAATVVVELDDDAEDLGRRPRVRRGHPTAPRG
jgi:acyl-CoA hydrolase